MDSDDGGEWLLSTLRAAVRATTGDTDPGAAAEELTDALGGEGVAWVGAPGVRDGVVRIRAASAPIDAPVSLGVADGATEAALAEGTQAFETLDDNSEYQQLRAEFDLPALQTGVSVPLGGDGVLHWYSDRDLTTEAVRETAAEMGDLLGAAIRAGAQRRELARERERLEAFRSSISHDLGNPLNLGAGRLDLARTDCESDHLDHVERAFEQINDIVDDGLTLVDAGSPIESVERLSLREATTQSWEHVAVDRVSLTAAELTVTADSKRLRRLLTELFENVVVHTDSAVDLRVEPIDGGFAVVDTGPGVPEKHREYVFDRGYTTAEDRDGNGLAIVAAIADAHGWTATLGATEHGTRIEIHTERW